MGERQTVSAAPDSLTRPVRSEDELAAVCAALGARTVGSLSASERALLADAVPRRGTRAQAAIARLAGTARAAIAAGRDPLGEAFTGLRPAARRRARGATYTPAGVVDAMIRWAKRRVAQPVRVVDPGAGSGRFAVAAGRAFAGAELVAVESDPLAALMTRAHLAAAGLSRRARVVAGDYRSLSLAPAAGPTLFIGNPPYLRHHAIEPAWKDWLVERAAAAGLGVASRLAGLHVHFLLATLGLACPGDAGVFITSAEWLDVGYGRLARALLAGPLGLVRLDQVDPRAQVFPDALTTAVIAAFAPGAGPARVRIRRVDDSARLAPLAGGAAIPRAQLGETPRWSDLDRPGGSGAGAGARGRRRRASSLVELGELCRVSRGQVTGLNRVWIARPDTPPLPASLLRPTVTRARDLLSAGAALSRDHALRRVIDLPADLDALDRPADRESVERFLAWARALGADRGYIARHRRPWWSVRLLPPAPILATYMARRPPVFVRNLARVRHINIAHGLYPRVPLSPAQLDGLAAYLSSEVRREDGRTYAGGLTKFEPGDMQRLLVPRPPQID